MQPFGTLKGFGVTFKQPITQQYPEYKRPVYPRFRGRHRLNRHANGLEKCVGCSLCAAACPSDCIRVVAAENTAEHRVSPGERYARIYEINLSRCIFCGYCELACPFDAITLGNEFELSEYSRDDLIYTKDMLLAEPIKRVPVQDPVLYDLASGEFVAAAQVLVYAGAVMVMFLFVIAYLGGRADAPWAGGTRLIQTASVIAAASLLGVVFVALMLNASDRLSDEASITAA